MYHVPHVQHIEGLGRVQFYDISRASSSCQTSYLSSQRAWFIAIIRPLAPSRPSQVDSQIIMQKKEIIGRQRRRTFFFFTPVRYASC